MHEKMGKQELEKMGIYFVRFFVQNETYKKIITSQKRISFFHV